MCMDSNTKEQQMILDNQSLVHYLVQKLGISPCSREYDDIVSIGTIGLIKATHTFDESKKIKFATYAAKCIKNEIFMYFRKANKYANDISLEDPIGDDGNGNELTLADIVESPEANFVEKIVTTETFIQVVSIILNYLKGKKRLVMLYRIGNTSQKDIAKMLDLSQSYVSRIEQGAISEIRKAVNLQLHYKEVFSMDVMGDFYKITFSSKDIHNFNKIFATLLQNLTSTATLPDFKVDCNKERIIVLLPAHLETFSFIAQIMQEIDNFSMEFVSDKTILPKDNTGSHEIKSEVNPMKSNADSKTTQFTGQSEKIRNYIFTLESFSVKQIKSNFPNASDALISQVLRPIKKKGLITATSRGNYVVNKI